MENNNSYEKFLTCIKQKLAPQQVLVECSTNLDIDEQINRVLGVDASVCLSQTECLNGEATTSGVITINLLYATESEQIGAAVYSTSFNSKIQNPQISPDCKIMCCAKVEEVIVASINSQTAKVNCNIVIEGFVNKNQEIQYVCVDRPDVCAKTTETTAMYLGECKNTSWAESQQCIIKQPIQKLLTSTNQVICKNWEVSYNVLTIEGQIFNKIIYVTDEETPKLVTVHNCFDFKQDIEFENLSKDGVAELNVCVVQQDAKCVIDEKNNQTTLELEIPLCANICTYENKCISTICDLFSTSNDVFLTNVGYNNCIMQKPEFFEKKIETNVSLTENEPRIDKLLAVSYTHIQVVSDYVKDEQIVVEAIIKANLIYLNDEENKIYSVDVEVPTILTSNTDLDANSQIEVFATLSDVDVMVKKGREVYVDAVVKVFANVCVTKSGAVISKVEFGEFISASDAGIEIYFAKAGDNVWDIAKQLKVKPEQIERQNQEVSFPLEKDENICIYYN